MENKRINWYHQTLEDMKAGGQSSDDGQEAGYTFREGETPASYAMAAGQRPSKPVSRQKTLIDEGHYLKNTWDPSEYLAVRALFHQLPVPEGTRLNTGKLDRNGKVLFSGDWIQDPDGVKMQIHFGAYQMYCPADGEYMENIGFYVTCDDMELAMPLGPTEEYAIKVSNDDR